MDELQPDDLHDFLVAEGVDAAAAGVLRDPNWICHQCKSVVNGGMKGFQHHMKRKDHLPPFICGQGGCVYDYTFRSSLYNHLRKHHMNQPALPIIHNEPQLPVLQDAFHENLDEQQIELHHQNEQQEQVDEDENSQDISEPNEEFFEEPGFYASLEREAELSVLRLRGINYMTSVAVKSVQEQCLGLIQHVASQLKNRVRTFLSQDSFGLEDVANLLSEFTITDPFLKLNTKTKQLEVFKKKYGLLEAVEKPLNTEFQSRQHPHRPMLIATQVGRSFQYLSIIEILKCVMSDPYLRDLIIRAKPSEDGCIRSFFDGTFFQSLPVELLESVVVYIVLYIDDLELLNALSSRVGNWNMAGIYFGILNLPSELNALLTYIFVTALAFAADAKKAKVWEPLLKDLKTLETEGVEIVVDGQPFSFKAVLVAQSGDCKAAHEVLGFAPASSHAFCRSCYIRRPDMWKDGLLVGEPRTPERHIEDVHGCKNIVIRRSTGVAGPPLINGLSYFEPVYNSIFDIFHDLQEGICKMEVKLALRYYVCIKKYFTEEQLMSRVKYFDYGLPDVKNKPSPRITAAYLKSLRSYNMHQSGSQMWLLTRAFPFLFGDLVPADDKFMQLISLLNQIMTHAFSHAHTEHDLENLDGFIAEHHLKFLEIFPGRPEPETDAQDTTNNDEDDPDEVLAPEEEEFQDFQQAEIIDPDIFLLHVVEEADVGNQAQDAEVPAAGAGKKKKRKPRIIRFINKHHHLKHYVQKIRQFGALVQYWCIRFEAKHHFFKLVATVCNNFINILKTLMEMLQMKVCADWKQPRCPLKMGKRGTKLFAACDTEHSKELIDYGFDPTAPVYQVNHVTFRGVDYRPELYVTLKLQSMGNFPTFAIIKAVYVNYSEDAVYLVTQEWQTVRFEPLYCAFEVAPPLNTESVRIYTAEFPSYRLLAKWKRYDSDKIYLAPRTIA